MKIDIEKTFGENAGKIWKALNRKGSKTATQISKETKITIINVHTSLGWLSREGKITAEKKKSVITYSLS